MPCGRRQGKHLFSVRLRYCPCLGRAFQGRENKRYQLQKTSPACLKAVSFQRYKPRCCVAATTHPTRVTGQRSRFHKPFYLPPRNIWLKVLHCPVWLRTPPQQGMPDREGGACEETAEMGAIHPGFPGAPGQGLVVLPQAAARCPTVPAGGCRYRARHPTRTRVSLALPELPRPAPGAAQTLPLGVLAALRRATVCGTAPASLRGGKNPGEQARPCTPLTKLTDEGGPAAARSPARLTLTTSAAKGTRCAGSAGGRGRPHRPPEGAEPPAGRSEAPRAAPTTQRGREAWSAFRGICCR